MSVSGCDVNMVNAMRKDEFHGGICLRLVKVAESKRAESTTVLGCAVRPSVRVSMGINRDAQDMQDWGGRGVS